jgi:hypothetical protein
VKDEDPRRLIVEALKKHPEGLTILSVAKSTGLHRHTSSKYVRELLGAGILEERKVGPASLCYLKKNCAKKAEKYLSSVRHFSNKSLSKVKSYLFFSFLFSLLAFFTVAIIAQNTSFFSNNFTSSLALPFSNGTETVENLTSSVNSTLPVLPNETVDNASETNVSTQGNSSQTQIVEPSVNSSNNTVDLPPFYSNFGSNATEAKVGDAVSFFAFWQDDSGLNEWTFSWNASGTWENESYSFVSSYDENTQILTRLGWKYLKDLSYEDEVAVLKDGRIDWEKPI